MRLGPVLLLALVSPSPGCGGEPLGVVIEGERVPVIDMHLHTGDWESIGASSQEFIAGNLPFLINLNPEGSGNAILNPEGIVNELDKAGNSRGVLLAVYAPRTVG